MMPRWTLALMAAQVACHEAPAGSSGTLAATWIGADTGRFSGRARAVWCPGSRTLEIIAIKEDAGVGLVLYPLTDLHPAEFPAFDVSRDSVRRPGAAVAMRWFTESAIKAYRSDSGTVTLQQVGDRAAGLFAVHLRPLTGSGGIDLHGTFRAVPMGPDSARCAPADTTSPPADQ